MSDEEEVSATVDRVSLVRLTKSSRGVAWSVTVGVGTTEGQIEAARRVAETIAGRLARDVDAKKAKDGE